FYDGTTVYYDGSDGRLLEESSHLHEAEYIGFQGLAKHNLFGSCLEYVFQPEYGWNPIVEFYSSKNQSITLDLRSHGRIRPTHVRVYTLDEQRRGEPEWIEYQLEDADYYQNTISVPVGIGTYFLEVEWPTWISLYQGGKG